MPEPLSAGHDLPMQSSLLADDELPDAAALAGGAARRATPGHFDELRGTPGSTAGAGAALAAPWQTFFDSLGLDGWRDLPARQARVQQRHCGDGAYALALFAMRAVGAFVQ